MIESTVAETEYVMNARFAFTGVLLAASIPGAAQDSVRYPLILSSRWFHPVSSGDTLSTLRVVDEYHPDRIDWMYCTNDDQLAQLRARKIPYSLALNPQVPDSVGYTVKGRIQNLSGERLVAPWMRNWTQKNPNWGCVNAPEFKEVFYAQSQRLIDLQAYGLFVDDAGFNAAATAWGGCFCEYCVKGFTAYLRVAGDDSIQADFNYRNFLRGKHIDPATATTSPPPFWEAFRQFQTQSVVKFLTAWRQEMIQYAGRPVMFLTNNFGGIWNPIFRVFDVGIAELPLKQLNRQHILGCTAMARRYGKKQYFTLPSSDESNQLRALYLTYSAGSALVIPWDVFAPRSATERNPTRFFGRSHTFVPAYERFRPKTAALPSRRALRQSQSSWTFKRPNPTDSLSVYEYDVPTRRMILVQGKATTLNNAIIAQGESPANRTAPQVLYPDPSRVRSQPQGTGFLIQYPGDVLVLSVPTN